MYDSLKVGECLKLVCLKDVNKTLGILTKRYEEVKLLVAEEIHKDEIDRATKYIEELKNLRKSINQMENLNVQIGNDEHFIKKLAIK